MLFSLHRFERTSKGYEFKGGDGEVYRSRISALSKGEGDLLDPTESKCCRKKDVHLFFLFFCGFETGEYPYRNGRERERIVLGPLEGNASIHPLSL